MDVYDLSESTYFNTLIDPRGGGNINSTRSTVKSFRLNEQHNWCMFGKHQDHIHHRTFIRIIIVHSKGLISLHDRQIHFEFYSLLDKNCPVSSRGRGGYQETLITLMHCAIQSLYPNPNTSNTNYTDSSVQPCNYYRGLPLGCPKHLITAEEPGPPSVLIEK